MMMIINGAMNGLPERYADDGTVVEQRIPRNHSLAGNMLMNLARLRGYVVDQKKTLSAKLDLSKLSGPEISELLGSKLNELEPGARARIERMIIDAREEPEGPSDNEA